jgi:hypothetical protein
MTSVRRKLVKVGDLRELMAVHHVIEGTKLHVLELLMFGFAYSSYYLLLKTAATLERLDDEKFREDVAARPYRFGRKLEFGHGLELDADKTIFYRGEVAPKDLQ